MAINRRGRGLRIFSDFTVLKKKREEDALFIKMFESGKKQERGERKKD